MATILRYPKGYQFQDGNGALLALGKLHYYQAGTSAPQDTYANAAGTVLNTNPVVLDASGRLETDIYLGGVADYKEVLMGGGDETLSPWPDDDIPKVQVAAIDVFTGDSGSGGVEGLVPAPAAGDAAANKFLKASGGWAVPAGAGNVSTSGTPAAHQLAVFATGDTIAGIATGTAAQVLKSGGASADPGFGSLASTELSDKTTAGTAMFTAATAAAQTALLSAVVGDSGSGGTKGLVPAPGAGDAAAGKYLKADGTFAVPPGGSSTITVNSTATSGASAGDILTSDGSKVQKLTPGANVATALAVAIGSAGAPVINGGALGTPSSGTLTSCTGLPASGTTGFATVATSGSYSDLSSKPTLGTTAAKDIPATGNASATQVVYGSDTRLSDARTPSTHASSHGSAGGDAISIAASQVSGIPAALSSQNVDNVSRLGIGTTDTGNVLSVAGPSTLFANGAGSIRSTLSKHASTDTASFVFQDNYSGRAEFGLCGDDDFTMKVSADGSTWHVGLVIAKTTGAVTFSNTGGFTGDSGSGGSVGLVPAPAAGDAAAGKYLKADGSWAVASGGSMVYPGAGLPVSTGSAWGTSITPGTGVAAALAANVTGSGGVALATAPTLTGAVLAAGSTTVAPLNLTAGTSLTTPVAGALEYDGHALYHSPVAGVRGVIPVLQYSKVTASGGVSLNNDANAQSFLPSGAGVFPVQANVYYRFRAKLLLNLGTTTARNKQFLFATAGGAGFSWITYSTHNTEGSSSMGGNSMSHNFHNVPTAESYGSSNTYQYVYTVIEGEFVMSAGGTIQPQIQFTAAPGGTNTNMQGSYFELTAFGPNAASAGLT